MASGVPDSLACGWSSARATRMASEPSIDAMVAPVLLTSGQKPETEKRRESAARPPLIERAGEHARDRVEVEERQRAPHHVIGGPPPRRDDLARDRQMVVMAKRASLGRAGGAAGVDDRRQIGGPDQDAPGVRRRPSSSSAQECTAAAMPLCAACAGSPTHHQVRRGIDGVQDLRRPFGEILARDDDDGVRVGELVPQQGPLQGGVDGHRDGAELVDREPGSTAAGPFSRIVAMVEPWRTPISASAFATRLESRSSSAAVYSVPQQSRKGPSGSAERRRSSRSSSVR